MAAVFWQRVERIDRRTIVAALAQTAATDRSHQYIGPAVLCTAGSFSKLVNVVRVTRLACVDPTRAEVDRRLFE